jgi:hypothetical protein
VTCENLIAGYFSKQDMASQGVINAQTLASRSAAQVGRRSAHLLVLTLHKSAQ